MASWPCWVKCEVFKGMFSDEYGIGIGENHPGGFVSAEYVQTENQPTATSPTPGEIQGVVIDEDNKNCLVDLPWHESFGQKNVRVPRSDVRPR